MSELEIKGNIGDILGAMDHLNGKTAYPVYVPSLEKNVMFKEMTTGQEKSIVKTIVDSPVYNTGFIFAIRDIIKENCMEKIDVDALTLIDKTAICLMMRMKSIGSKFEYTFKGTDKAITVNIEDYVSKFNGITIPKPKCIEGNNIKITCSYPTILTEFKLEKEFRSNVDDIEVNNVEDMRNAIGEVFINEIAKYISEVRIITDDGEMVLNMDEYTFKNRLQIVEKIGNNTLSKVLEYIHDANEELNSALSVELPLTKEEQKASGGKTKLTGLLETGSDFFITS